MGGGVIARRKKTGREREGDAKTLQLFFLVCFYLLAFLLTVAEGRVEGGGGDTRSTAQLFSSSFFPCVMTSGIMGNARW